MNIVPKRQSLHVASMAVLDVMCTYGILYSHAYTIQCTTKHEQVSAAL